ncbi:DUF3850 domain-containing protein [Enterobacter mori]|uniref:DUF3850 domain-containing protein n=1 Tax=Enterobacter mori TaxID=539813 RepID=UPI001B8ABCFB|nr:DUF3850 domain-containing protein [Enterobacter mori]MBS3045989.1 DUF3850 domain-containing protein [Enterobacter mori]
MEHALKIAPVFFAPVADGLKHAELRLNDRDFSAGDKITLAEFDEGYTGESVDVVITHVADVGFIAPGYVLLSIELLRD